jgi:hypothetical protein
MRFRVRVWSRELRLTCPVLGGALSVDAACVGVLYVFDWVAAGGGGEKSPKSPKSSKSFVWVEAAAAGAKSAKSSKSLEIAGVGVYCKTGGR